MHQNTTKANTGTVCKNPTLDLQQGDWYNERTVVDWVKMVLCRVTNGALRATMGDPSHCPTISDLRGVLVGVAYSASKSCPICHHMPTQLAAANSVVEIFHIPLLLDAKSYVHDKVCCTWCIFQLASDPQKCHVDSKLNSSWSLSCGGDGLRANLASGSATGLPEKDLSRCDSQSG
eukprot:1673312-Amphidinium_carterae.1